MDEQLRFQPKEELDDDLNVFEMVRQQYFQIWAKRQRRTTTRITSPNYSAVLQTVSTTSTISWKTMRRLEKKTNTRDTTFRTTTRTGVYQNTDSTFHDMHGSTHHDTTHLFCYKRRITS
eukprot:6490294-Amphidinium_carterae.3